jgi:hypothetical protein
MKICLKNDFLSNCSYQSCFLFNSFLELFHAFIFSFPFYFSCRLGQGLSEEKGEEREKRGNKGEKEKGGKKRENRRKEEMVEEGRKGGKRGKEGRKRGVLNN